ncbi:hypothetical protein [Streptoalloteichus tenebrarius]|uniref:hypothetical protein n=1 Tax=Streptoalloteichus tenebrarius (strain ATCC 17920 / DSM 40477 / JCM 4838 / CBS 697.72 / NBRC 16177 / NCIMB 11028 / NRRL B-12390 / A12253. 1 / ISP 5477) TaxID=1933 RepID=UPI0020A459CE|nr:hypothetical protein [Streptoalloteichus tenebrarius]BFF00267.1 hypothetical protein GCM10020241_19420 [Streptoalloteichus tenebrarius]
MSVSAALVLVGACGEQRPEIGFGAPPAGGSSSTSATSEPPDADVPTPKPPGGGRALPQDRVDASALPDGYPRLVWLEGEDGKTLGAYGQEGGCGRVDAKVTEQTPQRVRILFTETVPTSGPCTMDLRYPPRTVTLDAPLGDRQVVLLQQRVDNN